MSTYIAIDLKSFYASVECVERGLDPLDTNLVVADASRTDKTICLAVTPSLKAHGIAGRARLFEARSRVREVNRQRVMQTPGYRFTGRSVYDHELQAHPDWEVDFLVAPPRMAYYMQYSARIYGIYLHYIAPEDIHVYSIDEVFIDATPYLSSYRCTAHELAMRMIRHVLRETGITATAGIGSNLYLAKVAMDIVAKHIPADADGVRIAELDETSYRRLLWDHQPLTAFWRVGRGTAQRLQSYGIDTMGQLARATLTRQPLLYRLFGIHAEFLMDHAWGRESCTMADIKAYRPATHSLSNSQVLTRPYTASEARVVMQEMADGACLRLVEQHLVTSHLVLHVSYDTSCLTDPQTSARYHGPIALDHYGRRVPASARGSVRLDGATASARTIIAAVLGLYDRIVNPALMVRRLGLTFGHVEPEASVRTASQAVQLDLFQDPDEQLRKHREQTALLDRERRLQEARLNIKKKFGKNAILKGLNFDDAATARDRNNQIGGHKA